MIAVTGKIYRGPRPKSLQELRDKGFTRVIDLQSGAYELFHDDKYEEEKKSGIDGIQVTDLDLSDIFPPDRATMHRLIYALAFAMEYSSPSYKIYIHCLHGKDRTGFAVAAFRMQYMKWNFNEAVKEMFSMGFHNFPYLWWVPFLKQYEVKGA